MAKKILILFLVLFMMINLLYGCSENKNKVYEISEMLNEEQYEKYMNDRGSLFNKLLELKNRFDNSSEFDFYAYGNNFIEVINKTIPESCVVNHGTKNESESKYKLNGDNITAAEAIQVSEKFFNLFPIKISEGKSLETADFNYHNDNIIPVILGSTYRKSFKLGDKFEGYYICERKMFKVIGFADSGYQFYLRSGMRMEVYDNYIMIPFEKFVSDSHYARASLLQQICGFIVPHSNHNSAVKSIQKQLKDIGLEAWIDMITVNKKSIK